MDSGNQGSLLSDKNMLKLKEIIVGELTVNELYTFKYLPLFSYINIVSLLLLIIYFYKIWVF